MTVLVVLGILVVGVALLLMFVWWTGGACERSPREVADILRTFVVGEPSGHLADDFIHIPIANPALDQIRARFEQLVEQYPDWEPQAPFPSRGVRELEQLVQDAEAVAG